MELKKVLNGIRGIRINTAAKNTEIKKISYRSGDCSNGSLFAAIKGAVSDGHDYARKAYEKGARAFITERKIKLPKDAEVFTVANSRRALCAAAANFYDNPSLEMKVFGVVGTNGKTTTTYILEAILTEAGLCPGVIGTVNYRYAGSILPAKNTTPESLDQQRMMRQMRDVDVKSVITEVSSHALHQGRVDNIYFDAGIFTNLTQDHLDYHLNMRNYFLSKRRFFNRTLKLSKKKKSVWAAVNVDDSYGMKIFNEFNESYNIIPFSMNKCRGVYSKGSKCSAQGSIMNISTPKGDMKIDTCLTGEFNVYNVLGAVALCIGSNIPISTIKRGVENLKSIPGRMQKIPAKSGHIFVDYAHTPDALERVIRAVRRLDVKRIITVFGCGGDRDAKKRAKMGSISAKLSDISIITSDNPRSEEPAVIINEILEPIKESGNKVYFYYISRKTAIKKAIDMMLPGDAVIIAGKGHETYQIIKGKKLPFSDVEVVKKYLKSK